MNEQELEQRAREFFAAEYERDGKTGAAEHIRTQPLLPNKNRAVRAIAAALRQQPAPVVDEVQGVIDEIRKLEVPSDIVGGSESYGFQRGIDAAVSKIKRLTYAHAYRFVEVDETTPSEHK